MTDGAKRKLIEVALPLEAINRESAREKSIRHGHPSTLHIWWARRPLAACRAVLFAQLVDDPSSHPDRFPTEEAQAKERQRLFELMERLVLWENAGDDTLMRQARDEIAASFDGMPPAVLDPFAGGGAIPLEAQRLGLEVYASDLNPVAVLINKALVEVPPKWAGRPPIFPDVAESRLGQWSRATGLAEDVRRYGKRIGEKAQKVLGPSYPMAKLADGTAANVIAWIWARAVKCPNPACGVDMPLVRSLWLSKKKGQAAYIVPRVESGRLEFSIAHGEEGGPTKATDGTVTRSGAVCIACRTTAPLSYVRSEGSSGRMSSRLLAIVAEANRRRIYLPPNDEHVSAAQVPVPSDLPDTDLSTHPQYMGTPRYGLTRHADLFTPRQQALLTTLGDLVREAHDWVHSDALAASMPADEAREYASAVTLYLGLCASKMAAFHCSLARWRPDADKTAPAFGRQAIGMVWDYAECMPFAGAGGDWLGVVDGAYKTLLGVPATVPGSVEQQDARRLRLHPQATVSTDPPYYDNVPYADLADFFYVWLRRALHDIFPATLDTVLTPKTDELVADQLRWGGKEPAQEFFENGFVQVFARLRDGARSDVPITVYYAFKQSESDDEGTTSTGWQTLLEGMLRAGWEVTATWPMRTEGATRMRNFSSNALASSIVLALRPRGETAVAITRRSFLAELKTELPGALRYLQQGSIAPVDLAQAAIGPGMAVFSRHSAVVEADGAPMTVRTALALINQVLDEVLAEQEGDFDADSRFCVKWFTQFGWNDAEFGHADQLSRSTNTSVDGLVRGGIFWARAGRARLLGPEDLTSDWDPLSDERVSVWEVVVRLAKTLNEQGADESARLMALAGQRVDLDTAKELAYLLYRACEQRGWTESALLFNGLGTSWADLASAVRGGAVARRPTQSALDFDADDEE